jgi:hypothetical protein
MYLGKGLSGDKITLLNHFIKKGKGLFLKFLFCKFNFNFYITGSQQLISPSSIIQRKILHNPSLKFFNQ